VLPETASLDALPRHIGTFILFCSNLLSSFGHNSSLLFSLHFLAHDATAGVQDRDCLDATVQICKFLITPRVHNVYEVVPCETCAAQARSALSLATKTTVVSLAGRKVRV